MWTEDDKKRQFDEVRKWFSRLVGAKQVQPDQVIWHYTSGEGLIGILSSGRLFATQAACLNDVTEVRYAAKLLIKTFRRKLETLDKSEPDGMFLERYITMLEDTDEQPNHATSFNFVTCFSKRRDDLSQWRGYAGGENGYALGFRVKDLLDQPKILFGSVNYDASLHEELAAEVADKTVELFNEGFGRQHDHELSDWGFEFLKNWDFMLGAIAPFAKNPSFANEEEVRISRGFFTGEQRLLEFRQKQTLLARHLPLEFVINDSGVERFPICEILVGPARHKHISAVGIRALLDKYLYPKDVVVSLSQIPFQAP